MPHDDMRDASCSRPFRNQTVARRARPIWHITRDFGMRPDKRVVLYLDAFAVSGDKPRLLRRFRSQAVIDRHRAHRSAAFCLRPGHEMQERHGIAAAGYGNGNTFGSFGEDCSFDEMQEKLFDCRRVVVFHADFAQLQPMAPRAEVARFAASASEA